MDKMDSTSTADLFDLLESNQSSVVEGIKEHIQENINSVKEPWLVNGLFDYYLQTNSDRCMDILIGISKEPHDKFLIEKILDGLRLQSCRKSSLTFLGHLIRKQPAWLYKVVHLGLFKELITILRTDTDIVILLTGLLALTSLLPILPMYLMKQMSEIFDVYGRLTTWAHTSHNIAEEHLLHLQVGLYSFFHRLYAMYPCNFLSYLRHSFGTGDKRVVFTNTIKPMLETVKLHPMLITATKEGELGVTRWRNKPYDEIIADCALVSLDVLESGLPEEVNPIQLRPRMSTTSTTSATGDLLAGESSTPVSILRMPVSSLIQQSLQKPEMTDLSSLATLTEDSAPPTPSSFAATPAPYLHPYHPVVTATLSGKSMASPPETAIEATPENTPMQTPVKDKHLTTHFKLPPTSPAVKHLNFGKTPPSSIPSSPAPNTADYTRRDSIFDTNATRRDSVLMGRLEKIVVEQQHSGTGNQQKDEQHKKPIPLNLTECEGTSGIDASSLSTSTLDPTASTGSDFMIGGGPLTPLLGTFQHPEANTELGDEEMDELRNVAVAMPDRKSLMAFAQRVQRLRTYSHCTDQGSSAGAPSLGSSPSSTFLTSQRMKRSNSCPDVYKKISPGAGTSSTDSVDGSQTPSHQMELSDEGSTPKADVIQPYEHLFDGLLPSFLQHPGQNISQNSSPHRLLDICITKAAALHGMSTKGDELNLLRGQVDLLHAQLLFERHRREAHALRNRSLAKRCRSIQQQEQRNYALEIQWSTAEKEIIVLKKELSILRTAGLLKEKESALTTAFLESKVADLTKIIKDMTDQELENNAKYNKLSDEYGMLQKEIDQRKADIFQLENEIKDCKKYVSINAHLKTAYETQQKEVILLGELYRRQQESLIRLESNQYVLHQMEELRLTYENEISDLKNTIDFKSSQTEAALGLIQDLEAQLNEKDQTIVKQKKIVQDATSEYDIQIKALDEKYESIKSINKRLELEILNLQHQVAVKSFAPARSSNTGRRIPPANGDSPHNSANSDVDSATSAGGFQMSPDHSLFIFGSPQFGPSTMEMNDLQRVIGDDPAEGERQSSPPRRGGRTTDEPGPSSSRAN